MHSATKKSRYKGIKGKYWDWFSDYVRMRDFLEFGTCISCSKKIEAWDKGTNAGHFIPAGKCGFGLLFDEENVHLECIACNGFNEFHLIPYARNLDIRYSDGFAKALEERYNNHHFKAQITKEWGKKEYETKLEELKQLVQELAEKL